MYVVILIAAAWLLLLIAPTALDSLSSFKTIEDLYLPLACLVFVWLIVCELGYNILLILPKGVALELHEESICVCTPFGLKEIPRKAVKGCKNPVHRMTRSPKSGLVIVSVSPKYRVIGPYGFKVNPRFYGASVKGESEQSIVKKVRAWRKVNNC